MSTCVQHLPNLQRFLFLTALIVATAFPGLAHADGPPDTPKGAAIVKEDPDVALMGEFSGPIAVGRNEYEALALQIRTIGGGNFEALQYPGGLPGERASKEEPIELIGKTSGDYLMLSGGPWAVVVEKEYCLIIDRTGKRVGRLERVTRRSPTMGALPPKDSIVLFDGSGTDQFTVAQMTDDGLLMQGAEAKQLFQDFNLHLEFRLPCMPPARDQGRANSGVYLLRRYEVQILDSFALHPVNNGCAALYKFRKPDLNMCFPPLQWQTYDIVFTAPRWASDGSKVRNGRVTVWHNGVKVQDDVELPNKTGAGKPEEPTLLPILLQDHGNPVRYRNIWIVDRGLTPTVSFPVDAKPAKAPPKQVPVKKEASPVKPAGNDKPSQPAPKPAPVKKAPVEKPAEAAAQASAKGQAPGEEKSEPATQNEPAKPADSTDA